MADSSLIAALDQKLMENDIIDPAFMNEYKKVHVLLNTYVRNSGKILTETNFEKGDQKLREWLQSLSKKGLSQEKLTSYLRCGLAHLCYDFIQSSYKSISNDDLITRSIQSFKMRNYNNSYFKTAVSKIDEPVKKKAVKKPAAGKKEKSPVKKISVKKTAKKTVVKKSSTRKKTAVVKAVKKATLKKTPGVAEKKSKTAKPAPSKKKESKVDATKSFFKNLLKRGK